MTGPIPQQPAMSGASGPAYASAPPRTDPVAAASAQGPTETSLRARWDAYEGRFNGPLKPLNGQPDLNVITNRCGPMVRQGVDFLFGPILKLAHSDSHAQEILDAVWGNEDRRMTLLSKARINGGVYGHVFVKIVTPRNKKPLSADNPPRLVVQNPEQYSVETSPDDCDEVIKYLCTWQSTDAQGNPCWRRQTTTRIDPDSGADETYSAGGADDEGPDETWEIQNWTKASGTGNDTNDWQPDGAPIVWNYPFAPIVDWQNYPNPNQHWGLADVDDSYINLNRQLHLVESNTNSVMYSHGHPWLFATGADTQGVTPTPGVITDLGSPDAKIIAVTASGDAQHMMDFSAQIRADMDEASATPGVATGRVAELPKGAISGILVRLLYQARLARMEHERRLYGEGIRELCRRVLILCGQETVADDDMQLFWQDPLPQDDVAMAQMALALQKLGVSDHSIYALIGLNYETEQEYKQQEAQEAMKAALQGGALPNANVLPPSSSPSPTTMQPGGGQPDGNNTGAGGGGDGQQQQPQFNTPPVNHPAAVAARAAAKAAGAAMKKAGGQA